MGYMRHNVIVVSSFDEAKVLEAHAKAHEIFDPPVFPSREERSNVTGVVPARMNHYGSFMVGPDGSKEGWPDSDVFDERREQFVGWLREQASLAWVEVQYDDDDLVTKVVRSSDHDRVVA